MAISYSPPRVTSWTTRRSLTQRTSAWRLSPPRRSVRPRNMWFKDCSSRSPGKSSSGAHAQEGRSPGQGGHGPAVQAGQLRCSGPLHSPLPELRSAHSPRPHIQAVIYTDAFYLEGETRVKAGAVPEWARFPWADRHKNGLGFAVRGRPHLVRPRVCLAASPQALPLAGRVHLLSRGRGTGPRGRPLRGRPAVPLHRLRGQRGGQVRPFALRKGYGKDLAVNGILAAF